MGSNSDATDDDAIIRSVAVKFIPSRIPSSEHEFPIRISVHRRKLDADLGVGFKPSWL